MAITDRNLPEGAHLVAKYKGQQYELLYQPTYLMAPGAKYEPFIFTGPEDFKGRAFKSPSAAGSAVMGGIACNGWRFWSLADEADDAPNVAPKKGKVPGTRTRSKKAPPEAAQAPTLEDEDYLIDSDGKPIRDANGEPLPYQGEVPLAVD
jgi:hypothetical protein